LQDDGRVQAAAVVSRHSSTLLGARRAGIKRTHAHLTPTEDYGHERDTSCFLAMVAPRASFNSIAAVQIVRRSTLAAKQNNASILLSLSYTFAAGTSMFQ